MHGQPTLWADDLMRVCPFIIRIFQCLDFAFRATAWAVFDFTHRFSKIRGSRRLDVVTLVYEPGGVAEQKKVGQLID